MRRCRQGSRWLSTEGHWSGGRRGDGGAGGAAAGTGAATAAAAAAEQGQSHTAGRQPRGGRSWHYHTVIMFVDVFRYHASAKSTQNSFSCFDFAIYGLQIIIVFYDTEER